MSRTTTTSGSSSGADLVLSQEAVWLAPGQYLGLRLLELGCDVS